MFPQIENYFIFEQVNKTNDKEFKHFKPRLLGGDPGSEIREKLYQIQIQGSKAVSGYLERT